MMSDFVAGDNSYIKVWLKNSDGTARDLTDNTVTLVYQVNGGTAIEREMTVTGESTGEAEYQFVDAELTEGTMRWEVVVENALGKRLTSRKAYVSKVRKRVGA